MRTTSFTSSRVWPAAATSAWWRAASSWIRPPSSPTRVAACALASAIWRRLCSSASAFSMPFTCCSALAAIFTIAVEISPLLAASSSLMAEKSLALLPI